MGRNSDYTGVEQTCPFIDKVIGFIDSVEWSDEEKDLAAEAKKAVDTLEIIRGMNSNLRDFGNKQAKELAEMEKDRDYYQDQAKSLQEDVKYLEKQLQSLES